MDIAAVPVVISVQVIYSDVLMVGNREDDVVNEESEFEIREIAEKLNINLGGGLEGNFKM